MSPTSSFLGKAFLAIFYHIIFSYCFIYWIIKLDFHLLFKNILTITAMLLRKITLLAVFIFYNEEKKKDLFMQLIKKWFQKHLITSVAIQTHCLQECVLIFFIVLMCYWLKQIQKLEAKQVWIWIWAVFKTYLHTFRWEVCCRKEQKIKKLIHVITDDLPAPNTLKSHWTLNNPLCLSTA